MPNEELQKRIAQFEIELGALKADYYRNNFTSYQEFSKFSTFTGGIQVTVYTTLPATCQIGQLASNGGKLYHCSAANTWTAQT